jgi:1-hydroxycarotenoid 3,4-desaturase
MQARASGFPLLRHTVFFGDAYKSEFDDVFARRRLPAAPTVYVCAQDRGGADAPAPDGPERLLCLVNAPPDGDIRAFDEAEIGQCQDRMHALFRRSGLEVVPLEGAAGHASPAVFERLFPATGGALYGRASHGWMASFQRPGAATKVPGLYVAGGSAHPGPGVPMAAISGRLAAARLLRDLNSTSRSSRAAMPGGTSTR